MQTTTIKDKVYQQYVAVFDNANKVRSRARYKKDGTGKSATFYFWFKAVEKLPQAIKDYAKTNYPSHRLSGAEKVMLLPNKPINTYRVKMRKSSTLVTVYLDEQGKEVDKKELHKELVAENKTKEK
ncbi:MAG: hypothetical protein GY810_05505 [Aureispira sp.]|nr:hypothetical protein [Aureispira sp.]